MEAPFLRLLSERPTTVAVLYHVFAPIVASPLLEGETIESGDLVAITRAIGALYVPFTVIPIAIRLVHAGALSRAIERWTSARARVGVRTLAMTLTPLIAGALMKPLYELIADHQQPWLGWLASTLVITWIFALPGLAMDELRIRAEKSALAERHAALTAQIEALQARTNPHFLFNALNAVAELIHHDPRLAEATIERIAMLLRYSLASGTQRLVPIERELDAVRAYLSIQQARFGARLITELDVSPSTSGVEVPPLCLQPIVENAVLHGARQRRGTATVRVRTARAGDDVVLTVEDDGPGPGASDHRGTGTSLTDLGRRLALLYGADRARLDTGARPEGGFIATLTLPAHGEVA